MESIRVNKAAQHIKEEMSIIFRQKASDFLGKMISVTVVRMSPDLGTAKIYLSIFPPADADKAFEKIHAAKSKLRYLLGKKIKNKYRKIPELFFYIDDSLDYSERIDELLK